MLKKSITYEDFNGNSVTEDHYFHLSKADLIEMEMSQKGGMHEYLQQIVASEDGRAIIQTFKELILSAYGKKSDDGRRFLKTPQLREEFQSSEAYSALFMELCTDAGAAAEFVNGVVPAGLDEEVAKLKASEDGAPVASRNVFEMNQKHPEADPTALEPRLLTNAEVAEMDSDELKSGLATGRYRLQ